MPKVSLVSSVYNRADDVEASVRSMLAQTFDDLEVVIIDDGSTDNTLAVVKSIQDPRLKIIEQLNTGFTRAIARAVAESSGDYVAIVDGGDMCKPERAAVQSAYLDNNLGVAAVGSWVELYEPRTGKTSTVKLEATANPKETLLKRSIFWHSEVMFRKSVYTEVGGYRADFFYSQDNDLWLRMAEVADLAIVPQVLQRIIKFEGGITTSPDKLALARAYRAMAVYCATERRAGRPDPITAYGNKALLLRPRSATLANRLATDGFKNTLRGNTATGRALLRRALNEKLTPTTLALFSTGHLPGLHSLRNHIKKFQKTLHTRPISTS